MPAQPTDVAAVLADPTRFAIYERLVQSRPRSFTVQEVAEAFSLHPNVARTHLARLEEIGLVESVLEKSGRGGRPGKRYSASDEAVTLQFPRREWLTLARLLVETVERLGPDALQAAEEAAHREGVRLGRRLQGQAAPPPGGASVNGWADGARDERLVSALSEVASVQQAWRRQDGSIGLRFATCVFRELLADHGPSVCAIHRAMLRGVLEGAVGPIELHQQSSMGNGQATCDYVVIPAAR
ncbi:MAG: helix-turn-helix domain-containing protein [Firmicutes bacterium]|uniref:Helix-turn-helix domain-containing protein n=1 Tax=Geochorda subterranea TaxID=3109564 RepID=A0ABZ1BS49_9FIRM|nr:helix-turn-helix domain-containing protein [Limnochorda sp. LNt]NLG70005.1 helix-turn-helix domain-containing protein [Bacillota bacterium]WRP15335.1 helix-turn-helix domain-containing protein [Limnochorda sp. LNt]